MIQVITPTGDRPEAWKLCQLWMARQDYAGPVEWHVVDDGHQPMPVDFARQGYALHMHSLEPMAGNSQARNLLHLLDKIDPGFPVVCWEDDDYYSPDWLTTVAARLEKAELVGECQARYYNVAQRKGRQLSNNAHASLCSTAMRGAALATFRQVCRPGRQFIDLDLWRRHPSRHLFTGGRVVGIKGLPGRGGIGMGHRDDFRGTDDPSGALLREWVGADAEAYL